MRGLTDLEEEILRRFFVIRREFFHESPQLYEKVVFGTIIVDSAEEILANKLCTLLRISQQVIGGILPLHRGAGKDAHQSPISEESPPDPLTLALTLALPSSQ